MPKKTRRAAHGPPPEEVEATVVRALEIGVFCLERARMSQDTEFVRRQLEGLLTRVEAAVARFPKPREL